MTHPSSSMDQLPHAPDVRLPRHAETTRALLLKSHERWTKHRHGHGFSLPMKRFALSLSIVGVAACVLAVTLVPQQVFQTPVVHAQELVNRAAARVAFLPVETREEIEKRMKADMDQTLAEAKAAPDLRILSPEEFEKEMAEERKQMEEKGLPQAIELSTSVVGAGLVTTSAAPTDAQEIHLYKHGENGNSLDHGFELVTDAEAVAAFSVSPINIKEPVRYLAYTSPFRDSVVLGLDEDDVPVMKIIRLRLDVLDQNSHTVNLDGKEIRFIQMNPGADTN